MEKGSRVAGEALYYLSLDWLNRNTKYEQDHLHPYERFEGTNPLVYPCRIGKDGEAFVIDSQIFSYWQEEPMPQ